MQLKKAAVSLAAALGAGAIVPAVAGKQIRIRSLHLAFGSATTVKFQNGTTDQSGLIPVAANGVLQYDFDEEGHFADSAAGEAVNINRTGSTTVAGKVSYYEIG